MYLSNVVDFLVYALPILGGTGVVPLPQLGFHRRTRHRARKAITLLAQLLLGRAALWAALDKVYALRRNGLRATLVNLVGLAMRYARRLPYIRDVAAKEQAQSLSEIKKSVVDAAPDCGREFAALPLRGVGAPDLREQLQGARSVQREFDQDRAMGGIYHGEHDEDGETLAQVQAGAMQLFSSTNALYPGVFPGIRKFEAEIIAMVVNMLGGEKCWSGAENACGIFTSGGTESVLMATLAHREYFRETRGITQPEIIACTSAHAAIDKACHYFGIKLVHIEPDPLTMSASPASYAQEINANTIMLYTSAPSYPHGVVDPIPEIAALAKAAGIGCHVDNCLGGFLFSALKRQKGLLPDNLEFDLTVPGVTSISCDMHKYGYCSKGASVVAYSNKALRRAGYTTVTDWSGGLYCTHAMGGSRGGHIMAAAWATILHMGREGYDREARNVHATFQKVVAGIQSISGLKLMGTPHLSVVAFTSDEFDIYKVADVMKDKGDWELARMQRPPCLHICVNARTASIVDAWLDDLRASVERCRDTSAQEVDGMAGIYGQAGIVPDRTVVSEILKGYLDVLLTLKGSGGGQKDGGLSLREGKIRDPNGVIV
eukprot:g2410.t1